MSNPPAPGPHAGHRRLETPGPMGYNDHGDPSHHRHSGRTPGPLGDDDYGAPLGGKLPLISAERETGVAAEINRIVNEVNAAAGSSDAAAKLHLCVERSRTLENATHTHEPGHEWVKAYFAARLLSFTSTSGSSSGGAAAEPDLSQHHRQEAFSRYSIRWAGRHQQAGAGLSYLRIGASGSRNVRPAPAEHTRHWTGKGTVDGLRDRATGVRELRPYRFD